METRSSRWASTGNLATAEVYDPGTNKWSSIAAPTWDHDGVVRIVTFGKPKLLAVGGLHEIRPAQVQELVVALDVLRPPLEPVAPVVVLGQPMGLQQRAHRPVDDEHTPLELSHERFVPRTPVSTHNTSV